LALSAANALEQVKNAAAEAALLFEFVMAAVYGAEGGRGDGGGDPGETRRAAGPGVRCCGGGASEEAGDDAHARRSSVSAGRPTTSV
jgi:hypothetical protein